MTETHWAVSLVGSDANLARIAHALNRAFDPHLEIVKGTQALRSSAFDGMAEAKDVRDLAQTLVAVLNGAVRATSGSEPMRVGTVYRVSADGRVDAFVFGAFAAKLELVGLHATATVTDKDGNIVAAPPAPSTAQRWIGKALTDDDVADLLIFLGRADNWFDLYKAIEMAEKIVGGQHPLLALFPGSNLKLARSTANTHRHARGHRPKDALSFEDALAVVQYVAETVLNARC